MSDLLTATFDRGPAKYFHGREEVLNHFCELISNAVKIKRGSTFLIQGVAGAGKSTLLYEFEKLAEKNGWEVVKLETPASIWDQLLYEYHLALGGCVIY